MIIMILTKVHWGHSGCSAKPYHDLGFIMFHHDELVYGAANNEGYKNDYHEDKDDDWTAPDGSHGEELASLVLLSPGLQVGALAEVPVIVVIGLI